VELTAAAHQPVAAAKRWRGGIQPLGLVVPGWNTKTKRQQTLGEEVPAALADWSTAVIMPPPPSLPDPMAVAGSRAGSVAWPSEAACVFHLPYDPRTQGYPSSRLHYGDAGAARSWTKLSRTHPWWVSAQPVGDDLRHRRERKS